MSAQPITEFIQRFLAARKTMGGEPEWNPDPYDDRAQRVTLPLQIDGLSTNANISVVYYPYYPTLRFRILICTTRCIWRLDHVHDEPHINSFNKPRDLKEHSFAEPHYHSWDDNKRFCTKFSLPDRLENARITPAGVRTFDSSLRWFCGETNVAQPATGEIELPRRTRLL
jgi:hypothetical protein